MRTSVMVLLIGGALCFASLGDAQTQVSAQPFRDCSNCPEMVKVPAGDFIMGAAQGEEEREGLPATARGHSVPQHRVNVASFAVGKYDVTRDEYAAFVAETNRPDGASCYVIDGTTWKDTPGRSWRNLGFTQTGRDPAVCVNWDDAQAYVAWLSQRTGKQYRLLSEAKWEYAARAGTTTAYYWGDAVGSGNTNCDGCGSQWDHKQTSPGGSFRANAFGLYDMSGNVWQWLGDCWNANYNGAPTDGSAWASGNCGQRVIRGGSWLNKAAFLSSAYHNWSDTGTRHSNFGFRVARTI